MLQKSGKINRILLVLFHFVWVKDYWRRSGNGLAPIQVFNAVLSPTFAAAQNSLPGLHSTDVRREAQTSSPSGLFRAGFPQTPIREG
jgi:hypothetical protein